MRKIFKLSLTTTLLLFSGIHFSVAQNKINYRQIDSLKCLLPTSEICQRVLLMHQIGHIYETTHSDSALYFAQKALEIAEQHDYDSGIIITNHQIGDLYQSKRNYLKAFVHYKEAYDLSTQNHQVADEVVLTRKLGFNYFMRGDYANALQLYKKALAMSKDNHIETANILKNIGIAYSEQENYEKAKEFLLESIETFRQLGEEKMEGNSSNNLAMVCMHNKEYSKALQYANRTLEIRKKYNDVSGIANAYTVIGRIYQSQNLFDKAIEFYNKALAIRSANNDLYNIAYLDNYLSDIYFQQKQYAKSISYAQKSLQAFNESGVKRGIAYCYELLYKNYEALQDFKQALHFHKLSAIYQDSLMNDEKARAIANLEASFEITLKEKEILEHKQQNEILLKEKALQQAKIEEHYAIGVAILGALLTAVFLAGLFYRIHLKDKKTNAELKNLNQIITEQKTQIEAQAQELKEANLVISATNTNLTAVVKEKSDELQNVHHELDTFLYHTSHDLRQPLVNFIGVVELAKISIKDEDSLYLFDLVGQIAKKMDNMLQKMQAINDIYANAVPNSLVDLDVLLDEVKKHFDKSLENIDYQVFNNLCSPVFTNYYLLSTILKNLIENSICYKSPNAPFIYIDITKVDNSLIIDVKDNGEGIPDILHSKIFDMYFRGSENSKGNGLGLYIVKKAVEQLKGTIEVQSQISRGSSFKVTIPLC